MRRAITAKCVSLEFGGSLSFYGGALIYGSRLPPLLESAKASSSGIPSHSSGKCLGVGVETSPYYWQVYYHRVRGFSLSLLMRSALIAGARRRRIIAKCIILEFGESLSFSGKRVNLGFETSP